MVKPVFHANIMLSDYLSVAPALGHFVAKRTSKKWLKKPGGLFLC
jgi:hypothetical protein